MHIVEDLKIGGLERVIETIATGLDRDRYDVRVWCITRGGDIADALSAEGIPVSVLGMKHHRDPFFFIALCRRLLAERIDILHAHGYTATTIGRLAAIVTGVPRIFVHLHSTYFGYTRKQLLIERILSAFTDAVICCSDAVARFAADTERISPSRIRVIYNGIRIPAPCAPATVPGIAPDVGDTVIGCVASLVQHKGHRYLLESFREVRRAVPKAKLLLVGEGVLRQDLERAAAALGIADAVIFHGKADDVAPLLSLMDVVVLPSSEREGLGIALIEAMALGKPVVGTAIGGIPETVTDNVNGRLVPPRDAAALAEAIMALATDRALARKLGANGRDTVRSKFTAAGMLSAIDRLYRRKEEVPREA